MKKIAVVIPVFNNLTHTKQCLKILDEQLADKRKYNNRYPILVVDDGSSDGTGSWIKMNFPDVTILEGDGHLWWSGGINVGAKYAMEELGAEYVLLWNNDITPAPDYFEQLDRILDEINDDSIVGSKIYMLGKKEVIWSFGGIFNPRTGVKFMLGSGETDRDEFRLLKEVDWLPGMGTLVPVCIINKIGYWDQERFPQYHGDSDYTLRAKKAGYKNIVYPQLRIWNDKTSSGITHGGTFRGLFRSLTDIRSGSEIRKNFMFYRIHSESVLAYLVPLNHYFRLVGGFLKWKALALLKVQKDSDQ